MKKRPAACAAGFSFLGCLYRLLLEKSTYLCIEGCANGCVHTLARAFSLCRAQYAA